MSSYSPVLEPVQPAAASARSEQLARGVMLTLALSVPAMFALHQSPGSDPDVWWHLRTAQWILQHHAIPVTDPFSRLGPGHPWQAYSWLFELILLRLFNAFGLVGLLVYCAGMLLAITAATYRLVAPLKRDFSLLILVLTSAAIALCPLGSPRSWLFSILFFILQLDLLQRTRNDGQTRRLLWLFPIYALWANCHIQFIDGLLVLVAAAMEPVLMRWWPWPAPVKLRPVPTCAIALGCVAATTLNPYGWHIYQVAYSLASEPGVINTITELMAPAFRSWTDYLTLALAVAPIAVMAWKRRFPLFYSMLLTAGFYLSFRSRRDLWIVITVAAMILAAELAGDDGSPGESDSAGLSRAGRRQASFSWRAYVLVGLSAVFAILLSGVASHVSNAALQKRLENDLPAQAVDFIHARGYAGPLFNTYGWGGFLMYQLRMPVSMDGRAAFYGEASIGRSDESWSGKPDWNTNPDLQTSRLVVGPASSPLTQLLRTSSQFQLVYEDKLAAVFVRRWSDTEIRKTAPALPVAPPARK